MLALELGKLGADIKEMEDGLRVGRGRLRPARLDAHEDHRLFMAFSLASLLFPSGTPVEGIGSVDVSYPSFINDLCALGARARRVTA
jgi:3-phosphoshikimate 1-carboxyvinyltransferase